jgi:hypothetical protein
MKKKILYNLILLAFPVISWKFIYAWLFGYWGRDPLIHNQIMMVCLIISYFSLIIYVNRCLSKKIDILENTRNLFMNTKIRAILISFFIICSIFLYMFFIPMHSTQSLNEISRENWDHMNYLNKYSVSLSIYIHMKNYRTAKHSPGDYIEFIDSQSVDFDNLYRYVLSSLTPFGA